MPINYLHLLSLTQKVGKLAFFISSFFGLILIFLTLFGVRKIFGTYKYLIVIFSSLGIFLAAMEMVIHPNLHFYNSGFVFFTLSTPFNLNNEIIKVLMAGYTGVYTLTISLIAVQFIYRYWALFSLKQQKYFRGWKSLVWVAYCLFFGIIWAISAYTILMSDETTDNYFNEEFLLRYNVVLKDKPVMPFVAYDPKDGSIRWLSVLYTVTITSIMIFQYSVMIYCGWKMYSKMEEKIHHLSATLKHHHRQLFKTLVLQITSPTIFLFSPLILIIYLPYFQIELSFPAGATVCAFNFYPALDSVIILLVVSEYKFAAKRMWNSAVRRNKEKRAKNASGQNTTGQLSMTTLRSV